MAELPNWVMFLRSAAKDGSVCCAVGHGDVLTGRWWLEGSATEIAALTARVQELEEGLERLVAAVTRYFGGEPQAHGILEIRDEARRLLGLEEEK